MDINKLYNNANNITEVIKLKNKYTFLTSLGVIESKYLNINDSITKDLTINNYINNFGEVLLFPNYVNGNIVDVIIRPMGELRTPLTYREVDIPYGMGTLSEDFKFGDPLFVVEGVGDFGALKLINKNINVIAIRTNSFPKNQLEFISTITNNIIMIPDNDNAGKSQLAKTKNKFNKLGVNFSYIEQFGNYKDLGDFADDVLEYTKTKNATILNRIKLAKDYYINNIKAYNGL